MAILIYYYVACYVTLQRLQINANYGSMYKTVKYYPYFVISCFLITSRYTADVDWTSQRDSLTMELL